MMIHDATTTDKVASMYLLATCDTENQAEALANQFLINENYPALRAVENQLWVQVHNFTRAKEILEKII